jgi:protein-S-isoprenylcysteine O-methyltransferase Ste14
MNRHLTGAVLVAMQFGLLAALGVLAVKAFLAGLAPTGAWLILVSGLALGLWALNCNRPGNFNIRPTPRAGGLLVRSGPYRWIRHPMYSAVLLVASGCAWASAIPEGWVGLVLLAGVLTVKAVLEERWMLVEHAGYANYQSRTKRFVPGLF